MSVIRFRERMAGSVAPVGDLPWTIRPRGPRAGDGVVRLAATTADARPAELDLDGLDVLVTGHDRDRDGFRAEIARGSVRGLAAAPLPVVHGFADILTRSVGGRRMHYRLLVVHGQHAWVVDGVKAVRGGVRTAWATTTTLHTVVVRFQRSDLPEGRAALGSWLDEGGAEGEVVLAGVLRVRGLVRQGLSLRGPVASFLIGFVRRAVERGHR